MNLDTTATPALCGLFAHSLDHAFQTRPAIRMERREAPSHLYQLITDRLAVVLDKLFDSGDGLFRYRLAYVRFV